MKIIDLLSYREAELEIQPLTVLVGANGAGKSNLLESVRLLRDNAAGKDRNREDTDSLVHMDHAGAAKSGRITVTAVTGALAHQGPATFQRTLKVRRGRAPAAVKPEPSPALDESRAAALNRDLDALLGRMAFYDLRMAGHPGASGPAVPAGRNGATLQDDLANLPQVLHTIVRKDGTAALEYWMERLDNEHQRMEFKISNGATELGVRHNGIWGRLEPQRMSQGTLELLALLAALKQPQPPPLICIENPGNNIHPDRLPLVAQLLQSAEHRAQVIVTTHQPEFLDALWETPQAIVITDNHPNKGTTLTRMDAETARMYEDRYTLGELWRSGNIDGNPY